jgi:hypothetical protein
MPIALQDISSEVLMGWDGWILVGYTFTSGDGREP